MTSRTATRLLSAVLALSVTGLVLWWLLQDGVGEMLVAAARHADPWLLAAAAVLAVVIQWMRAWRFAIMTDGAASPPSRTMVGVATRLIVLNYILPFKLGELGFPLMMKRAFGTPLARGTGILLLCRFLDFGVVASILLLTAALLLAPQITGWSTELIALAGLIALCLPVISIDWLPSARRLTRRSPKVDHLLEQLSFGALMIRPLARRALVVTLTLAIWAIHALIAYLAAASIQSGIDFPALAMASAASNLAFALPISGVAGLGPPQAAWATMLNLTGVDWPMAITTALLCHGVLLATISIWAALGYLPSAMRGGKPNAIDGSPP